ncbi:unnamed protein product, partial [Porites evermanni]
LLQVPPNATTVNTKHNDIAHFTCTALGQDTVRWKREGEDLKEEDLGVAILSALKKPGSWESHLLIAVTSEDLRGKYECFSSADSNATQETFFIGKDPDLEGKLTKEETWAIILASSITMVLVSSIAFFLWRGNRRLKKARAADLAERSRTRNSHHGARVNRAVEEEIIEERQPGTEVRIEPDNRNNNSPKVVGNYRPQSQTVGIPEVIVRPKPEDERSTQF